MKLARWEILILLIGLFAFAFVVVNPLRIPLLDFSQISFATYHGGGGGGGFGGGGSPPPDSIPYDGRDLTLVDRQPPPAGNGVQHFRDSNNNVVGWKDNGICSGGCREKDGGGGGGGGGGGNDLPTGYHDGNSGTVAQADCKAVGWATDPDNGNASLLVKIYHSNGTYITATTANQFRSDLLAAGVCPGGQCAFAVNIYGLVTPDVSHNIMVKAVDAQTGEQKELNNTRKQIKCSSPPPSPTPTPTPVPPAGNWLKVVGGDVYSGGRINMTVPPPAGQYNATGVVTSGSSITNFQTVSNWMIQNYSITSGKFDYDYFFKRFKSKTVPIYSPIVNSTSLQNKTIYLYDQFGDFLLDTNGDNFNNKKIAILINGNLRIQNISNKFTPQNASVIFITSGNVLIDPNMTEINAAIVSTGNMSTGTGTIPLTIKGLLVSYGGFSLSRAPASSATPGETLIYDPNLVVTLNDLIGITNFFWQEVAP